MFNRKNTRIVLPFLAAWALICVPDFVQAQDQQQEEAARAAARAEAQRATEERAAAVNAQSEREHAERSMRELQTDSRDVIASARNGADRHRAYLIEVQKQELAAALESFDTSLQGLTEALGFKKALKDPARKMTKSTLVFLEFIKRTNKQVVRFDSAEFKDFTSNQLAWEALTTAERLAPELVHVVQVQGESSVDVNFLSSLSTLHGKLLRLQWMTQRLK